MSNQSGLDKVGSGIVCRQTQKRGSSWLSCKFELPAAAVVVSSGKLRGMAAEDRLNVVVTDFWLIVECLTLLMSDPMYATVMNIIIEAAPNRPSSATDVSWT